MVYMLLRRRQRFPGVTKRKSVLNFKQKYFISFALWISFRKCVMSFHENVFTGEQLFYIGGVSESKKHLHNCLSTPSFQFITIEKNKVNCSMQHVPIFCVAYNPKESVRNQFSETFTLYICLSLSENVFRKFLTPLCFR